ncbi:MAG: DUF1573 domain-containing protein [Verrucomicrobiota bacterium]
MKFRRSVFISSITLAASLAPGFALASTLVWDRTEARLEMSPNEESIRTTFTVTNKGEKTLRIAKVETSCGCTGTVLNKRIMEPGESTEIVGTFNKGKRSGLNHNKLRVFLDSEPEPVATLHMIVNIPKLVEAQPQIVYWNNRSTQSERTVRIKLDKRYVDEITDIRYNRDLFSLTQEVDPNGQVDLILKITPKSYTNMVRETIIVSAKGKDGESGQARVHTFVQP